MVELVNEMEMLATTHLRAANSGMCNVEAQHREVVAYGIGLLDGQADHAMLFSLLNNEEPGE